MRNFVRNTNISPWKAAEGFYALCGRRKGLWLEDIIRELQLPCLVVAEAGLGTINHTILTLEYLKMRGIEARGVILNHFHPELEMEQENRSMIEQRGKVPVLACIPNYGEEVDIPAERLMELYQ